MALLETATAYIGYFNAKDTEAIAAMVSDDIQLKDWDIEAVGKPAFLSATQGIFDAAPGISIQITDSIVAGDQVALLLAVSVDADTTITVVDWIDFDPVGKIRSVRAFKQ